MISATSLSSSVVKSIIGIGVKFRRFLTNLRFPDDILINGEGSSDAITVFGGIVDDEEGIMSDAELLVMFLGIPLEDAMFPIKIIITNDIKSYNKKQT